MRDLPYNDYLALMETVKKYASPRAKLTGIIKAGKIIKVKRGLYIPAGESNISVRTLANKIYGPSYISFEYALAWYDMIPEQASTVTSASLEKNKSRLFHTPVGDFSYQSVAATVFPHGVARIEEEAGPFMIAAREKALCDTVSKAHGIADLPSLEVFLFEDMRIDRKNLFAMSLRDVRFLAPLYNKKPVMLLLDYLKKRGVNE